MRSASTICALSTPAGSGAIAVIRISGDKTLDIVQTIADRSLKNIQPNTAFFCRIMDQGTVVDETIVTFFAGPHSFTGEDTIEISCHGSGYIIRKILSLLTQHGAEMAQAGEFTMRAYLNGKMDLSQAEAVADLIASENAAAHKIALNQMRGGFSNEIKHLREELIHFASLIELELDFAEEDVEFADRTQLKALMKKLIESVTDLRNSFQLGNALKMGIPVVIAGRPNAGKSSWMNALANDEVAIVSDIAGTTRDKIEVPMTIDGILFRFTDTAGLRNTTDTIEAIGVERAYDAIKKATFVIYVFDITETTAVDLNKELQDFEDNDIETRMILVANKIDLVPAERLEKIKKTFRPFYRILFLSSHERNDVDHLKKVLRSHFDLDKLSNGAVVSNARHETILSKALTALEQAQKGLLNNTPADLVAMDIRATLHYLGEITGTISTEDLLGNIFSKFCIGK